MEEITETMEIEVATGEILMHFDVRGTEDPGSAEHALEAFEGAAVSVEKEVAAGRITVRIRGANATPRIVW